MAATTNVATANDAIVALLSLVKITANGTSYQAYAYCLKAVKSEVDPYLKGQEAKKNTKLSGKIAEIMGLYEYGDSLFKRIDGSKGLIDMGANASPADKQLASKYFSRFPEDKKNIAVGGVLVDQHGPKIKLTAALSKIFRRAYVEYGNAVKMQHK